MLNEAVHRAMPNVPQGVYVSEVVKGGLAAATGLFQVGDQFLEEVLVCPLMVLVCPLPITAVCGGPRDPAPEAPVCGSNRGRG